VAEPPYRELAARSPLHAMMGRSASRRSVQMSECLFRFVLRVEAARTVSPFVVLVVGGCAARQLATIGPWRASRGQPHKKRGAGRARQRSCKRAAIIGRINGAVGVVAASRSSLSWRCGPWGFAAKTRLVIFSGICPSRALSRSASALDALFRVTHGRDG